MEKDYEFFDDKKVLMLENEEKALNKSDNITPP